MVTGQSSPRPDWIISSSSAAVRPCPQMRSLDKGRCHGQERKGQRRNTIKTLERKPRKKGERVILTVFIEKHEELNLILSREFQTQ